MDYFGIGSALKGSALIYFRSAIQSGRTTSLIESLKDGDRVICLNAESADFLRRRCKEKNIHVECVGIDHRDIERLSHLKRSHGRTVFDHDWLEKYYLYKLECAANAIDRFENELSHRKDEHEENTYRDIALYKWMI